MDISSVEWAGAAVRMNDTLYFVELNVDFSGALDGFFIRCVSHDTILAHIHLAVRCITNPNAVMMGTSS